MTPASLISQTSYLFLNVETGLKEFYSVLRFYLKKIFGENFCFSFYGSVHYARHAACLAHGVNTEVLQKLTRVTEQRYTVNILSHDLKKQDNMA